MKYLFCILLFISSLACAQAPNTSVTAMQSAVRTDTEVDSSDFGNFAYRGGHFIVNVTTATSGTYTPTIQGKDPVSGTYYDILPGPTISTTGITILKVYPGINAIPNGAASDILPSTWRVKMVGASTPNMVFSVAAYLMQ